MSFIRSRETKASWLLSRIGLNQSIPEVPYQADYKPETMDCLIKRWTGPAELSESTAEETQQERRQNKNDTSQKGLNRCMHL